MFYLFLNELKLNLSTISFTFFLFCLYIIIIPLLIGFSQEVIYHYHLGIIWTCVLFCFLMERFYEPDLEDGTLCLYFLSSYTVEQIFLTKLLAYWSHKLLGILCGVPILSIIYHFEISFVFYLTVIMGSFVLTLICGLYSLFTHAFKKEISFGNTNNLQAFATLPILIPLIIICASEQTDFSSETLGVFIVLITYISFFLCIFRVFVSITLHDIVSR